MTPAPILLKVLLQERHWQTYRIFCSQYDKAAGRLDRKLVGTWPSRAQLHRWVSGDLKGLPYPDHCRILEEMFPGHTAQQLLSPTTPSDRGAQKLEATSIFATVTDGLATPDMESVNWSIAAAPTNSPVDLNATSLPARITAQSNGVDPFARDLGQKLLELQKIQRLSDEEIRLLAGLAGNVVELSLGVDLNIERNGNVRATYRHEVLNLTKKPITRLSRELWFVYTSGPLVIEAISEGKRRVAMQRVHDTPTLSKFACQISPAIQPGETGVVGYECTGGQFKELLYWRQSLQRFTRHFTLRVRHQGAGMLANCSAVEEQADGSESFAAEDLLWDYEGDDIVITMARDYLRPNQCVTLRWDVQRAAS